MTKKFYLLAIFLAAFALSSISQSITDYSFSAYSGTFIPLSGATSPALSEGGTDEGIGMLSPLDLIFGIWVSVIPRCRPVPTAG